MKLLKKIILIAANTLCVSLLIAAIFISNYFAGLLRSQHAAVDWRGESGERFAQVSVFIPEAGALAEDRIRSFRRTVDQQLVDASIEAPKEGRLWTDAYSAVGQLTVKSQRGSTSATAIGVGGDFFLFHPYYLLSGSYIYDDDLMKDRVVLDEELAWKLFGGTDLAGMKVMINNEPYHIAGVVRRESDFASEKAGAGGAMIFVSYETLVSGGTATDASSVSSGKITCYEVALPDPISGFAKALMENNFPLGGGEVVENTGRFGIDRMFSVIESFGLRSMRVNGVIYPYWENAARYLEDWSALILLLSIIAAICPLITLIWLAVRLKKYLNSRSRDIKAAVERRADKITRTRYEKRLQKEQQLTEVPPALDDFNIDSIVSEVLEENKSESVEK